MTANNRIKELERQLELEKELHTRTKIKLKSKERELHTITGSVSYKLAKLLAKSKHYTRAVINHLKELNPRRIYMLRKNSVYVRNTYGLGDFYTAFQQKPSSNFAVVIHLFYPEMAEVFARYLSRLKGGYDLYITIPIEKKDCVSEVIRYLPSARVAIVPNCGRDVLPFTQVMQQLAQRDYKYVLKLHSKKSPHRGDGEMWRDQILDSLVPKDDQTLIDIHKTLNKSSTAIIGPKGQYVSLLVNFSATAHYLKRLVGGIYNEKTANELVSTADEYGFYAGTMFWARTEAIMPLISRVSIKDFEPELGQEDTTFAHALERGFTLIPELANMKIYELKDTSVELIDPHTTNIPTWADVALKDE